MGHECFVCGFCRSQFILLRARSFFSFFDELFRLVFRSMFRHCFLREVALQELAIDRAKLEALPIDDLVGSVCVNLKDDLRSLRFRSELSPCLMGCDDWSP